MRTVYTNVKQVKINASLLIYIYIEVSRLFLDNYFIKHHIKLREFYFNDTRHVAN